MRTIFFLTFFFISIFCLFDGLVIAAAAAVLQWLIEAGLVRGKLQLLFRHVRPCGGRRVAQRHSEKDEQKKSGAATTAKNWLDKEQLVITTQSFRPIKRSIVRQKLDKRTEMREIKFEAFH